LLYEKINYNQPKKGFEFNSVQFLNNNYNVIMEEICSCKLWQKCISDLMEGYFSKLKYNKLNYVYKRKIQILFQISAFINRHDYIL
jgi:hypothetical protein